MTFFHTVSAKSNAIFERILIQAFLVACMISCHGHEPCLYTDSVVDYYIEITTNTESGARDLPIIKWTTNPVIKIFGTPSSNDLSEVSKVIRQLNALQNEITLSVTDTGAYNIEMHFIPYKDFKTIAPYFVPRNFTPSLGYACLTRVASDRILEAIVLIDNVATARNPTSRAIREELTQALGLTNDSYNAKYPDSIFNGGTDDYAEEYIPIDELLIQMHYSQVIKPGMRGAQLRNLTCWQ